MKLRTKDKVVVIAGKDKGKEGVIERIYIEAKKAVVKGANMYKKHVKKSEAFPQGGLVSIERPLDVSKIMLVCPHCKKKVRVGYSIDAKGKKHRICKSCKQQI